MTRTFNPKIKWMIIGLIVLALVLTGCGRNQEKALTANEALAKTQAAMGAMTSFHFLIATDGTNTFLDQGQTILFKQAEGDFVAPDRVSAQIKIVFSGIVANVSIVNIGDAKWETNPLTGAWQESTAEYAFQPVELLDPQSGIISVIVQDVSDLVLEEGAQLEELPGQDLIKLTGSLEGTRINQLSYGLIDNQMLKLEMWITPGTYELDRLVITDPKDAGEDADTLWTLDFWNFNEEIDIQPPM